MSAVISNDLGKKLVEAGLIPAQTRRFIIDAEIGKAVMIYYEVFADEPLVDSVFGEILSAHMGIKEPTE